MTSRTAAITAENDERALGYSDRADLQRERWQLPQAMGEAAKELRDEHAHAAATAQ